MKKLFTLIAAALFAVSASAEATRISLGGQGEGGSWSWGWTQAFGAEADLSFTSQWGEFNLATTGLTEGATYKLVVEEPNALINLRINGATEADNQYIAVDKTEITGTIPAGTTKIELQATEAKQLLKVKSFEIAGTQTAYSTNWGVAMLGGSYTTSQWAELYLVGAAAFESQTLTLKFATAVPEGALQLKVKYADGSDESYPQIPAGTKAEINIEKAVKEISLQATDAYSIDIIGVYSTPIGETVPDEDGGEESATPVSISWGADDIAAKGTLNGKTFGEDFKLTITDTDESKLEIDANNVYFGDATNQTKFTHRLKSGGKSSSNNKLTLTIPSKGTLKVYARTGSNSATDRHLVLTQDAELFNEIIQEADAIQVKGLDEKDLEKDTNVYPIISVPVEKGTVEITYPDGSMNFYGFEFVSATGIQEAIAPAKVISNDAIYNLAGQKVNESYKGIVIKNGKKYFQK
ncbi:MAG: hypothetical protein IJ069_04225 [Prevotella sp.]|nr:hypothetical protein [Prevotella sp.]